MSGRGLRRDGEGAVAGVVDAGAVAARYTRSVARLLLPTRIVALALIALVTGSIYFAEAERETWCLGEWRSADTVRGYGPGHADCGSGLLPSPACLMGMAVRSGLRCARGR